jgi:hypothetical protein
MTTLRKLPVFIAAAVFVLASCQQSGGGSSSVPGTPTLLTADAGCSASDNACQITLRWKSSSGAVSYIIRKYTLDYSGDVTGSASFSMPSSGSSDVSYVDYDVEPPSSSNKWCSYAYSVAAEGADGTESAKSSTAFASVRLTAKINTDWLLLFYADGDNSLNGDIWKNVQQVCTGLNSIAEYDSSGNIVPKTGKNSVTALVLWDGSANASETAVMAPSCSSLMLMKPEDLSSDYSTSAIAALDLSASASWLRDSSGNQETDMSSPETLKNFLLWAKSVAGAEHTVLVIADHGSGPHTARTSASDRTVCSDNTSPDGSYIESTDYPAVFSGAGYGTDNRIDLILVDACLEASVENAYELKDYADYYLASADTSPGSGFDYDSLVAGMGTATTAKQFGIDAVNNYKDYPDHTMADEAWQSLVTFISAKTKGVVTASNIQYLNCGGSVATQALFDLRKTEQLAQAVDDFAAAIRASGRRDDIFNKYLSSVSPLGNTLMYEGTYQLTYDLGWFTYSVKKYADENSLTGVSEKAAAVETALAKFIAASWRDGYVPDASNANTVDCSYKYDGTASSQNLVSGTLGDWFGVTIGGGTIDRRYSYGIYIGTNASPEADTSNGYPSWYAFMDMSKAYPEWNAFLSGED